MGVSVSAATAILLVAAMISFGMVFSAQDDAQKSYIESQNSMANRLNNALMTDLEINTAVSVYNSTNDFIYSNIILTNTGSIPIDMENLNLMINGSFYELEPEDYQIIDAPDSRYWMPGEVVEITIGIEFDVTETYRIWAITSNGVTDLLVYGGS